MDVEGLCRDEERGDAVWAMLAESFEASQASRNVARRCGDQSAVVLGCNVTSVDRARRRLTTIKSLKLTRNERTRMRASRRERQRAI